MRRWAWIMGILVAVATVARPAAAAGVAGSSADRSCLVWKQGGVVECFGSDKELDARSAELTAAHAARASSSCVTSLDVWAAAGFSGTHLRFWDEGVWVNLADYGFDDQLSSYYGGACSFHMAENAWGGGAWYPGDTGPYALSSFVGWDWNDRVSSVYID